MFYVKKIMNSGYGETVEGIEVKFIDKSVIEEVWLGIDQKKIDDVIEESGFDWNVCSFEEGKDLWAKLDKNKVVCVEYEDCIVGVGDLYCDVIESMLIQV